MADDLFPSTDAFSFMQDLQDTTTDINPAFPMPEQISIPELVPQRVLSPPGVMPANPALTSAAGADFSPISQLIKQTQQLPSHIDGTAGHSYAASQFPGSILSSPNEATASGFNKSVANDLSFIKNVSSPPANSQFLVNERIVMPPVNTQISSAVSSSQLASLSVTEQFSSMNAETNLLPDHMKQVLNNDGSAQSQAGTPKVQFVKTVDKKLMFVTEVNGKRVGYLIQPNNKGQPPTSLSSPINLSPASTPAHTSVVNDEVLLTGIKESSPTPSVIASTFVPEKPTSVVVSNELIRNKNLFEPELLKKDSIANALREKFHNLRNPLLAKPAQQTQMQSLQQAQQLSQQQTTSPPLKQLGQQTSMGESLPLTSPIKLHIPIQRPVENDIVVNKTLDDVPSINQIVKESEMEVKVETDVEMTPVEEAGQEIEFSENDLSFDEEEKEEETMQTVAQTPSTDEEEDLPLSRLKTDDVVDVSNRKRELKSDEAESLSAVAAKLKKEEEEKAGPKKRGRKKKKKDPREPVKPTIAYQMFFRDEVPSLRKQFPEIEFGELSRKIGQMWETLEPERKKGYQDRHSVQKAEYVRRLSEYRQLIALEEQSSSVLSPTNGADEKKKSKKKSSAKKSKKSPLKDPNRNANDLFDKATKGSNKDDGDDTKADPDFNMTIKKKGKYKMRITKTRVQNTTGNDGNSSPSLPSSDSSDEDEVEEDPESAISRIRQRAAELKEKIKKEKRLAEKHAKSKPVKMEVETISDTTRIGDITPVEIRVKPPVPETKQLPVEAKQSPAAVETKPPSPPAASKTTFRIPKKSNSENGVNTPASPRICIRASCSNPAKTTKERGGQYCSNECLVLYCREVFDDWVLDRQKEDKT